MTMALQRHTSWGATRSLAWFCLVVTTTCTVQCSTVQYSTVQGQAPGTSHILLFYLQIYLHVVLKAFSNHQTVLVTLERSIFIYLLKHV